MPINRLILGIDDQLVMVNLDFNNGFSLIVIDIDIAKRLKRAREMLIFWYLILTNFHEYLISQSQQTPFLQGLIFVISEKIKAQRLTFSHFFHHESRKN